MTPINTALYARELRLSLRNNAGAYGYAVVLTCSLAVLGSIHTPPNVAEVFLFIVGSVVSFAVIEAIATHGFTRALSDSEATRVIALGSSLGLVSIALAVGAAALLAAVSPPMISWPAGAALASTLYLLASAVEMSVARRIEEARDLE